MMGKLPLGVVSPYVKMSSGGCVDPLKFYATSYCTAYGEARFVQEPRQDAGTMWGGPPAVRGAAPVALTLSEGPQHAEPIHPLSPPRMCPRLLGQAGFAPLPLPRGH